MGDLFLGCLNDTYIIIGHGRDTTEEVDMQDVFQEVDELMTKLRVGMHKIKPCSRKYAFELPDIPKEADYLKLLYPYESKSSGTLMALKC